MLAHPAARCYHTAVPHTPAPLRILLVRFSSIGDIVLTTPLLRALRRRHPAARIAFMTKRTFVPLLLDNPNLDERIAVDDDTPVSKIAGVIRAGRYTHRLDLHGGLRTRALRVLVPGRWRGYAKHRWARAMLIRAKSNLYPRRLPVSQRYFDAAAQLDVPLDTGPPELFLRDSARREALAWLEARGLGPHGRGERRLVAFAPGSAHATKQWPVEHFGMLARALALAEVDTVVVGGSMDTQLGAAIARFAPGRVASAAGQFDLQGSAALLQRAGVLVSGDTGLLHMARALGKPVVAIFGPTVEAFGFFPVGSDVVVLQRELRCRPCSPSGGPRCPLHHHECLRSIGDEAVLPVVLRLLQ